MNKMKKSGLVIVLALLAAAASIFALGFAACENPPATDPVGASNLGGGKPVIPPFNPGELSIPIPHARILTNTTTPKAADHWPDLTGSDYAGKVINRKQFVIDWIPEEPKTDAQIAAALEAVYAVYQAWWKPFDPLPYFSRMSSGIYGVDYGPNAKPRDQISIFSGEELAHSASVFISFVRYWPPAAKTGPLGLTPYLSVSSWNNAASLKPRIAAYNQVKADMEAITAALDASPLKTFKITLNGRTFAPLPEISDSLKAVYRHGPYAVVPPTGNLSGFYRFAGANPTSGAVYVDLDTNKSGKLYEAYFGYVPPATKYPAGSTTTYPQN
jgi:hypothetical protein